MPGSGDAPTDTDAPVPADATAPPVLGPTSAETDREGLVAFYNATDGENWNSSDNWLSDAPLGEWEGVYTNEDGRVGRMELVGLERGDTGGAGQPLQPERADLRGNELSGGIPAGLGSLSNLEILDLGSNALSGEIPVELAASPTLNGWASPSTA